MGFLCTPIILYLSTNVEAIAFALAFQPCGYTGETVEDKESSLAKICPVEVEKVFGELSFQKIGYIF